MLVSGYHLFMSHYDIYNLEFMQPHAVSGEGHGLHLSTDACSICKVASRYINLKRSTCGWLPQHFHFADCVPLCCLSCPPAPRRFDWQQEAQRAKALVEAGEWVIEEEVVF